MLNKLRAYIADVNKYIYYRKYKKNIDEGRKSFAELYYRTWESGYFVGKANADPVLAWKEMEKILGVEYPISDRIKKEVKIG
jgi:hypothetical protein